MDSYKSTFSTRQSPKRAFYDVSSTTGIIEGVLFPFFVHQGTTGSSFHSFQDNSVAHFNSFMTGRGQPGGDVHTNMISTNPELYSFYYGRIYDSVLYRIALQPAADRSHLC